MLAVVSGMLLHHGRVFGFKNQVMDEMTLLHLDRLHEAARELLRLIESSDSLVITKDADGRWPIWAFKVSPLAVLDALAAAQPGRET